ncbi:MAG: hypothetical protein HYU36_17310 [Planctomycetes bacterium]|nr:hypothetical protein [Planctomycetota bacterium]
MNFLSKLTMTVWVAAAILVGASATEARALDRPTLGMSPKAHGGLFYDHIVYQRDRISPSKVVYRVHVPKMVNVTKSPLGPYFDTPRVEVADVTFPGYTTPSKNPLQK